MLLATAVTFGGVEITSPAPAVAAPPVTTPGADEPDDHENTVRELLRRVTNPMTRVILRRYLEAGSRNPQGTCLGRCLAQKWVEAGMPAPSFTNPDFYKMVMECTGECADVGKAKRLGQKWLRERRQAELDRAEQAAREEVRDLRARAKDPKLTPEERADAAARLPGARTHARQAITDAGRHRNLSNKIDDLDALADQAESDARDQLWAEADAARAQAKKVAGEAKDRREGKDENGDDKRDGDDGPARTGGPRRGGPGGSDNGGAAIENPDSGQQPTKRPHGKRGRDGRPGGTRTVDTRPANIREIESRPAESRPVGTRGGRSHVTGYRPTGGYGGGGGRGGGRGGAAMDFAGALLFGDDPYAGLRSELHAMRTNATDGAKALRDYLAAHPREAAELGPLVRNGEVPWQDPAMLDSYLADWDADHDDSTGRSRPVPMCEAMNKLGDVDCGPAADTDPRQALRDDNKAFSAKTTREADTAARRENAMEALRDDNKQLSAEHADERESAMEAMRQDKKAFSAKETEEKKAKKKADKVTAKKRDQTQAALQQDKKEVSRTTAQKREDAREAMRQDKKEVSKSTAEKREEAAEALRQDKKSVSTKPETKSQKQGRVKAEA